MIKFEISGKQIDGDNIIAVVVPLLSAPSIEQAARLLHAFIGDARPVVLRQSSWSQLLEVAGYRVHGITRTN